MFLAVDIINRIVSNKALNKYDLSTLKNELKNGRKLENIETYLTENFIVSNSNTIKITKYSDIKWVFLYNIKTHVGYGPQTTVAYKIKGTPVVAYLDNGKRVTIALVKSEDNLNAIYTTIKQKNSEVLIGETFENMTKYKGVSKKYKITKIIESIIIILLFAFIIIGIIVANFPN